MFLRPLPYPDAERLLRVNGSQSYPAVQDLRGIRSVEAWAAASIDYAHLTGAGDPVRVGQARVTDGFLGIFGAQPALGRLLTSADYRAADVVVLSYGAWQRIWGGRRDVVGRTIAIDDAAVVVAGVLSSSYVPPEALLDGRKADVWRPVDRAHPDFEDRYSRSLVVAGRLASSATMDEVRREASALAERRAREFPDVYVRSDGSLTASVWLSGWSGAADPARRLREAVWTVEPALPLPLVRSIWQLARASTARTRFDSWLFGVFAIVALLLAAGGIFGTLLYTVGLSRRELAIRLALGSERRSVEARVLGRALALLEAEPRHGYELSKLIEARSGGVMKVYAASLYPLLYQLEQKRFIAGYWVERPGKRRRRFYKLTAEGKRQLERQRRGFVEFVRAVSAVAGVEYA
jgi:DNA-binding PadR family transcriptional regulator